MYIPLSDKPTHVRYIFRTTNKLACRGLKHWREDHEVAQCITVVY